MERQASELLLWNAGEGLDYRLPGISPGSGPREASIGRAREFQFLTSAGLELLTQAQKLAYLNNAMDAHHG
jgi:hypothetical protein